MAKRFLSVVLCMLLVAPACILRAEETEIPLYETILIGYVGGGDDPLDDPGDMGTEPPPITRFRAAINQRILSVTSLVSAGTATIAVFDHHGELVCYEHRIFHSPNTTYQFSAYDWNTGDYTIYISSIGYAYQGEFEIE
jgi:hypothetical protein